MIIDKNFSPLMEQCFAGRPFSVEETEALIHSMLDDTLSDVRIASVLTAFRFTPMSKESILAIIHACQSKNTSLKHLNFPHLVDCCGTGGEGLNTVNISTMASIVAAAAGANVAKFTGKSLSSKSGSSSVLKFLDIIPLDNAEDIEEGLKKVGLVFIDAGSFYAPLKNISSIRKTLGFKTIIDLIFPIANPLPLTGQVVGVYHRDVMSLIISCVKDIGRERALVVHAEDGLDELSVCSATYVAKLSNGKIVHEVWKPSDFGLKTYDISELKSSNFENNAFVFERVLQNDAPEAIVRAVEYNAAGILWCAKLCESIPEGLAMARENIESGKAMKTFEHWKN